MMGTRVSGNVRRSAPQVPRRTRSDDQVHVRTRVTATSRFHSVTCNLAAMAVLGAMFASATRATTIGPDASGFTANNTTAFAFQEISGSGTRVLSNTDDGFVAVPIGFTFNFYGTSQTSLFVSSNGLITFGSGNLSFANDNLTTAAAPTQNVPNDLPLIAPLWDDWSTDTSGADAVYYQTLGSAPSRRLVIEWRTTAGCCGAAPPVADFVTFEAILYEGSGNILLQYLDATTTNSYNHGNTATVGIRDVNGQSNGRNLQWSFNSSVINDSSTVLFTPSCGNGVVDAGEQCDEGVANGTTTSCCTAGCQFRAGGETCRLSAGVCDPTETCSGASGTCPADAKSTAQCRASAGACDLAELCDGVNNACPADAKSTAVCRGAAGACDVAEVCDGLSDTCPADAKSTATCRASGGVCDVTETCDGVNDDCPADGKSSAQCRASGGVCDVAESCDGINNACPADAKSTAECRASGGVCDIAEVCDGVTNACPADAKSTAVCRAAAAFCDVTEACDGSNDDCPTDAVLPNGTTCRASAGICDVTDTCDGANVDCPADSFVASGTECRAVAGPCDVAEVCDGSSAACPSDGFEPATTVCRAASPGEVCDIPESCTGTGVSCPADDVEPATTLCRASTVGEVCDIPDFCDGTNKTCPPDAVEPSSTVCRASTVGEVCDVTETCDGTNRTCPADAVLPNGTTCRASAGVCDSAEVCNGSAKTCPSDTKSTATCRASTGVCDVAEVCNGVSDSCPADAFVADGTGCDDTNFCNGTQSCTGGVCGGGTSPCGVGQSCDEASDLCFTGSCPSNAAVCRTAAKNKVLIKNKSDDGKDKLIWKWTKGAQTDQTEFGDPTATADYALCFYDGSGALLQQANVPPSASKWSALGTKGYKYKDQTAAEDGITKIILKGGDAGKSKALVKGKGVNLPDFDSDLPIAMGDLPLVVQLRNNASGICWEGSFASPKKNQLDQFSAKTP